MKPVDIAVIGLVNAGKSSLINALTGSESRSVGPTSGTTTEVAPEDWTEAVTDVGRFSVRLLDTPGLEDIDHPDRGSQSLEAARRAELTLFTTDEDLTATALAAIQRLHAWGKPVIVVLNKADRRDPPEQGEILGSIRDRLAGIVDPADVVAVSAAPLVRERAEGEGGESTVRTVRGEPEIDPLRARLAEALEAADTLRALAEASDAAGSLAESALPARAAPRRKAERVADETGVAIALALAINPVPILDLMTAPAGLAILVRRLASVYGARLSAQAVQELTSEVVRGARFRLWGTLAGAGAGGLMKLVPGIGHVAGAITEGACAGLFVHIVGRALLEYFERGRSWGDEGLLATLDRIAASTDRRAVTRGLVTELKARLAEATGKSHGRRRTSK